MNWYTLSGFGHTVAALSKYVSRSSISIAPRSSQTSEILGDLSLLVSVCPLPSLATRWFFSHHVHGSFRALSYQACISASELSAGARISRRSFFGKQRQRRLRKQSNWLGVEAPSKVDGSARRALSSSVRWEGSLGGVSVRRIPELRGPRS